jgi:hypothetical protein
LNLSKGQRQQQETACQVLLKSDGGLMVPLQLALLLQLEDAAWEIPDRFDALFVSLPEGKLLSASPDAGLDWGVLRPFYLPSFKKSSFFSEDENYFLTLKILIFSLKITAGIGK